MTVRGTTKVVGVFGYPVKHSASPPMHNAAFAALGWDGVYVPFEVAPENLGAALSGVRALGMMGVNVTVPLKEKVAPFLDDVSERARRIGSVNTVVHRDGKLYGDSTDGPGFLQAVQSAGVTIGQGTRVVVLGAGGSSRAVVYALAESGTDVVVINRSRDRADALVAEFAGLPGRLTVAEWSEIGIGAAIGEGASLLVNTTSIGMHPNEDEMPPVPEDALTPELFVSDLIYNPATTRLLALAQKRGCPTQNGVEMLVRQGAISFQLWTGIAPPVDVMREAVLNTMRTRR